MPRHVDVKFELPDEVAPNLRDEDLSAKAKEALTMELLDIDRHTLFDLMTKYRVPVIDLTPEELAEELNKPFHQS